MIKLGMLRWLMVAFVLVSVSVLAGLARTPDNNRATITNVSLSEGWMTLRPGQAPGTEGLTVRESGGAKVLEYHVERRSPEILVRTLPMAGFRRLSLKIWSQEKTLAVIGLEDREKARFNAVVPLEPNKWTSVSLTPADFRLSEDSPVKKTALSAALLGSTFALVDLGKVLGLQNPGWLRLSDMTVEYDRPQNVELAVPAIIDGTSITVAGSGNISHPLSIRRGGKLKIQAGNVHLASDVLLDHGSLEIEGGTLVIDNKYQHQYNFSVTNQSSLSFANCEVALPFNSGIDLINSSTLRMNRCAFTSSGFTVNLHDSKAFLADTGKPGEFILNKGTQMRVNHCHDLLFWLGLGAGQKLNAVLPPSDRKLTHFALPAASLIDLAIDESDGMLWALATEPGSDVTIANSRLLGVGLVFSLPGPVKLANIKNNTANCNIYESGADRKLSLPNTTVKAWNIYPVLNANVEVNNSQFGELNAFTNARVVVRNSICDGSGGYVRVSDQAKAQFSNCRLNCSVVARNKAELKLERCTIGGELTAADDAVVSVAGGPVNFRKQELGHGRIVSH